MGLLASPENASFASEAQLSVLLCLLFLVRPSIHLSVHSSICPSIHSLTQEVAESPSLEFSRAYGNVARRDVSMGMVGRVEVGPGDLRRLFQP